MPVRLWGPQRTVNASPAGEQRYPQLTRLADGSVLYVWTDQATGDGDIIARRFGPDGQPLGREVVLAAETTRVEEPGGGIVIEPVRELLPVVSALFTGGYRVAWVSESGVVSRQYDASGAILSTTRTTGARSVSLADAGAGRTAEAVRVDGGLFVRLYSASTGDEVSGSYLRADTAAALSVRDVKIVGLNGFAVVVWSSESAIHYRVRTGPTTWATPAQVDIDTSDFSAFAVTRLVEGGFALIYNDLESRPILQVFFSTGAPAYDAVRVAVPASATLVALPNGGFAALWQDASTLKGQLFAKEGRAIGAEFTFAQTGGVPRLDAVATSDGRIVVTWDDATVASEARNEIRTQVLDPRDRDVVGNNLPERACLAEPSTIRCRASAALT